MALYPPSPFHALSQKKLWSQYCHCSLSLPPQPPYLTSVKFFSSQSSEAAFVKSRLPLYCQIQWGLAIWIFLDLSVNLDTVGSAFVTHFVFLISVIPCTWLFFYSSGFHIDFPFPSPFSLLSECLTAVMGSVFFLISILRWPPHQLVLL